MIDRLIVFCPNLSVENSHKMLPHSILFVRNALSSSKSPLFSTYVMNRSILRFRPISISINIRSFGDNSSFSTTTPPPAELVGKSKVDDDAFYRRLRGLARSPPPLSPEAAAVVADELRSFTNTLSKAGIEMPRIVSSMIDKRLRKPMASKNFRSCSMTDIKACTEFVGNNPLRIVASEMIGDMESWTPPEYLTEAVRIYCKRNRGANEASIRPIIDFVLSDIIDWLSTRQGSRELAIYREMPIEYRGKTTKLEGIVDYAIGQVSEHEDKLYREAFADLVPDEHRDRSFVNIIEAEKPAAKAKNTFERVVAPSCCVAAKTERSCFGVLTTGNHWVFYKSQSADRTVRRVRFERSDDSIDTIGPIVDDGLIEPGRLKLLYATFRMMLDDVDKECAARQQKK